MANSRFLREDVNRICINNHLLTAAHGNLYLNGNLICGNNSLPYPLIVTDNLGHHITIDDNGISSNGTMTIETIGQLLFNVGTNITLNNVQIKSLATPTDPNDACTKTYVDNLSLAVPYTSGILSVTNSAIGINQTNPNSFGKPFVLTCNGASLTMDSRTVSNTDSLTLQGHVDLNLQAGTGSVYANAHNNFVITATECILNLTNNMTFGTQVNIKNVLNPVDSNDVVNLQYLISYVASHTPSLGPLTVTSSCAALYNTNPNGLNSEFVISNPNGLGESMLFTCNQISKNTGNLTFSAPHSLTLNSTSNNITVNSGLSLLLNSVSDTVMTSSSSTTISAAQTLYLQGSQIYLNNQVNISNVADPVNSGDCVTLNYLNNRAYATSASLTTVSNTVNANSNSITDIYGHTNYLYTTTVTLTSSQLIGLYSAGYGLTLVSGASYTNQTIIPYYLEFYYQFGTVPYTSTGNLQITYSGNAYAPSVIIPTNANTNFDGVVNDSLLTSSVDCRIFVMNSNNNGIIPNTTGDDLIINTTSQISAGDGTLKIRITYFLITPLT
jgi:hypothetical protein